MSGELEHIKRLTFEAVKNQTQRERDTFGTSIGPIWCSSVRMGKSSAVVHIWRFLGIAEA